MNSHTRHCNDCKLGIKAYQNILGSLNAFEKLRALLVSRDHIVLSSIFYFAIVKYAKPFVATETSFGRTRYPVSHLKKTQGFSIEIHDHLLELRNTLIAHDDLESIEPRILKFSASISDIEFDIPVSIAISNKCFAYSVDPETLLKFRNHVINCAKGVFEKLNFDLGKVREISLSHPEQAKEGMRHQDHYGQIKTGLEPVSYQPPDFLRNEWLNNNQPDFSNIHNGIQYDEMKVRRDFYGPERIMLPNGEEFVITPNMMPPQANRRSCSTQ